MEEAGGGGRPMAVAAAGSCCCYQLLLPVEGRLCDRYGNVGVILTGWWR